MAVIKETGAIVTNANSYATETEADTYFEDMGLLDTWDTVSDKEGALVRGTIMIESRYRDRWLGYKTNNNQGVVQRLAWPRKANDTQPTQDDPTVDDDPLALVDNDNIVIGVNSIPQVVQYACMEAALMEGTGFSLVPNRTGRDQYVRRNKVDVIEQEFMNTAPAIDRFPMIDQLLQSVASIGGVMLNAYIAMTADEQESMADDTPLQKWLDSLKGG